MYTEVKFIMVIKLFFQILLLLKHIYQLCFCKIFASFEDFILLALLKYKNFYPNIQHYCHQYLAY